MIIKAVHVIIKAVAQEAYRMGREWMRASNLTRAAHDALTVRDAVRSQ